MLCKKQKDKVFFCIFGEVLFLLFFFCLVFGLPFLFCIFFAGNLSAVCPTIRPSLCRYFWVFFLMFWLLFVCRTRRGYLVIKTSVHPSYFFNASMLIRIFIYINWKYAMTLDSDLDPSSCIFKVTVCNQHGMLFSRQRMHIQLNYFLYIRGQTNLTQAVHLKFISFLIIKTVWNFKFFKFKF